MKRDDPAAVTEPLWWVSDALHAAAAGSAAHQLGLLTRLESGAVCAENVA